jgi:hypothetical protein
MLLKILKLKEVIYMNEYSPFLKFKNGELTALFNLLPEDRNVIVPLLEIPRDDLYKENSLIYKINKCAKRMSKNLISGFSFYIDNLEVPDKIKINGKDNYQYLLDSFNDFDIVPVIGFDRTETHNNISYNFANKKSKKIAIRITQDYFENFLAYKPDLKRIFDKINANVSFVLLLDCNYIEDNKTVEKCKVSILRILSYINEIKRFSKMIVSGSSIPTPIGEKVKTDTYVKIERNEITLLRKIKENCQDMDIKFGDYTVVSPEYSEINIDPRAMLSVIMPKTVYSVLDSQYIIRGKKISTHGLDQYFSQAEKMIKEKFYRGKDYSWGDNFLYERVKHKTKKITPASIIAPTVNAHIKFMIDEIKRGSI